MNGYRGIRFLIDRNYRDIAVEGYDEHEEKSGYQHEHEYTTLIARAEDGTPQRVLHYWTSHKGREATKSKTAISDEEFQAVAAALGGFADTPAFRAEYENEKREAVEREQRRRVAQKTFEALRPSCPSCNTRMTLRHSAHGWFWGCSQFPKCKGTRNIDAEEMQRLQPLLHDGAG